MNTRHYNDWKSVLLRNNPPPEIRRYLLEDDDENNQQRRRRNSNLNSAQESRNDEFYTQYSTVENELIHYKQHFKNKIVFCNCDDYLHSQFFWYFARNFNHLNLKKLITTSYNEDGAVRVIIDNLADYNEDGGIDDEDIQFKLKQKGVVKDLGSNGDFRSPESESLLKQADIIVTNPPFSLFRDFIGQIQKYKKKFLIIGNYNAVSYANIFPTIQNNKTWLGVSNRGIDFIVPNNYEGNHRMGDDGKKYANVNATWFTNLEHEKRSRSLLDRLHKTYNPNEYHVYDNFNAIDVNPVLKIPVDFADLMGVPITYLPNHNPEEFELIGSDTSLDINSGRCYINDVRQYARLIIRNKKPKAPAHMLPERDVSGWMPPRRRERLQQQKQKQKQQQKQQPEPQQQEINSCNILYELENVLGKKYRRKGELLIWDMGKGIKIIFGPDEEGHTHIWYNGPDSFEPTFEKYMATLEEKGCFDD